MLAQPLVLLTGSIVNVVFLVAYGLYTYQPVQRCLVGPLCNFDRFSIVEQVGLILLSYGIAWVLLFIFVGNALEEMGKRSNFIIEAVRALSRFQTIRTLLLIYGLLLLLGLLLAFLLGSVSAPLITIVAVTTAVCFWASRVRTPRPATDPYGTIGGADYQARRLWPLSWIRPNPKPPTPGSASGDNPANTGSASNTSAQNTIGSAGNADSPGTPGATGGAGSAGTPGAADSAGNAGAGTAGSSGNA
jgi:hypothetical protein